MEISLDPPKPAANGADETEALAQSLEEVGILYHALKELVPLHLQRPLPDHTMQLEFAYEDGKLKSITARPKLDS